MFTILYPESNSQILFLPATSTHKRELWLWEIHHVSRSSHHWMSWKSFLSSEPVLMLRWTFLFICMFFVVKLRCSDFNRSTFLISLLLLLLLLFIMLQSVYIIFDFMFMLFLFCKQTIWHSVEMRGRRNKSHAKCQPTDDDPMIQFQSGHK